MSFVLYALAKFPETQTRLRKELQDVALDETTDLDALNGLPYLEALIKEVLRLYTIVPTTGRQTTQSTGWRTDLLRRRNAMDKYVRIGAR